MTASLLLFLQEKVASTAHWSRPPPSFCRLVLLPFQENVVSNPTHWSSRQPPFLAPEEALI